MALTEVETYDVQAEGYAASNRGDGPRHNPYSWSKDNERCRAWIAGHAMATTELAAAGVTVARWTGPTPKERAAQQS
ncbi:hypothetical protein SCMU_18420 [Sinomonas cyclohexanicum]|uniref:Uncharacterized protein n=1 Tax=Sinomonas cyclohexanicum TaxID=322009 RepID=A0ABM7PUS4_SINCY|nr:hypothetical protein [Corynebacterium cyclohexanicum]BCT76000.1 hypothetical protein SCMU_18420 [Corynebacterium cyclohexanicum]